TTLAGRGIRRFTRWAGTCGTAARILRRGFALTASADRQPRSTHLHRDGSDTGDSLSTATATASDQVEHVNIVPIALTRKQAAQYLGVRPSWLADNAG